MISAEPITRRSVIELVRKELGMEVVERSIDRTEVYICDELFFTGTAAQVTAITKVDHRPVADGVMGPIASKLRGVLSDVVHGKTPAYSHWLTPVYEK